MTVDRVEVIWLHYVVSISLEFGVVVLSC